MQFQAGATGKFHVRARGKLGSAHRTPVLYVVNNSTRVHINDQRSGKLFLIDTGAEISVIPHSYGSRQPSDVHLTAANGTRIKTFGPKTLSLDLGLSRPFTWTFEMADVSRSIIGADFLHYFGLLVDVRHQRLVDPVDKRTVTCAVTSTSSARSALLTVARSPDYDQLLQDFPSVTRESPVPESFRHGVEHVLETRGPPLFARPRRLPPDRLEITRRDFGLMQKQGICRPSSSAWASPKKTGRSDRAVITADLTASPFQIGTRSHTCTISPPISQKKRSLPSLTWSAPTTKFRLPPAIFTRPL